MTDDDDDDDDLDGPLVDRVVCVRSHREDKRWFIIIMSKGAKYLTSSAEVVAMAKRCEKECLWAEFEAEECDDNDVLEVITSFKVMSKEESLVYAQGEREHKQLLQDGAAKVREMIKKLSAAVGMEPSVITDPEWWEPESGVEMSALYAMKSGIHLIVHFNSLGEMGLSDNIEIPKEIDPIAFILAVKNLGASR